MFFLCFGVFVKRQRKMSFFVEINNSSFFCHLAWFTATSLWRATCGTRTCMHICCTYTAHTVYAHNSRKPRTHICHNRFFAASSSSFQPVMPWVLSTTPTKEAVALSSSEKTIQSGQSRSSFSSTSPFPHHLVFPPLLILIQTEVLAKDHLV